MLANQAELLRRTAARRPIPKKALQTLSLFKRQQTDEDEVHAAINMAANGKDEVLFSEVYRVLYPDHKGMSSMGSKRINDRVRERGEWVTSHINKTPSFKGVKVLRRRGMKPGGRNKVLNLPGATKGNGEAKTV